MIEGRLGEASVVIALAVVILALGIQLLSLFLRSTSLRMPSWYQGGYLAPLALVFVLLSVGCMEYALVTHDFALAYVAENNSTGTPLLYSITGMWSALEGSILLWAVVLTVVLNAFVVMYWRRRDDDIFRWATAVLLGVDAFFLALIAGPASPFSLRSTLTPTLGAGPNALLQDNPLVAIHPPLIYSGLVVMSVPFALAIGTLVAGRFSSDWQLSARRWALAGWTALSVGVVLGAWWSYQVLGWGGFWGWDPVENAALLPWLVSTAYVHSVVVEERRGLFRVWNLVLAIAVFSLTILATYFTRSGVLQSVHAFSSSTLGPLLLGFLGFVVALGLGLLAWRGDRLRSPVSIDEPISREGAFVANNLLFVGFATVVLLGTVFPLAYEAVRHSTVTVGPPYFDTVAVPAALCVLTLMAVAPVLGWRQVNGYLAWQRLRTSAWAGAAVVVVLVALGRRGVLPLVAYFLAVVAAGTAARTLAGNLRAARQRRQPVLLGFAGRSSGGMVVHLGVVLAVVAIVSSTSFAAHAEVTFRSGQTRTVDGHRVQYLGTRTVTTPADTAHELVVRVDDGGSFYPAISDYVGRNEFVGTPAIDSSLLGDDVYLTVDGVGGGPVSAAGNPGLRANEVVLGVTVEPLVSWFWAGGLVVGVGGLLALLPTGRRRRTEVPDDVGASEHAEVVA
jgi:cytochrome c-type biogenesis protein CcmF